MNKEEKKLAKKLLAIFNSPYKNDHSFTREENLILERWLVHKILNEDAFHDVTSGNSDHKEFIRGIGYPFTALGDEERKKDSYLQFRNSKVLIIIRDILTVTAFLISLYLAIAQLIHK